MIELFHRIGEKGELKATSQFSVTTQTMVLEKYLHWDWLNHEYDLLVHYKVYSMNYTFTT